MKTRLAMTIVPLSIGVALVSWLGGLTPSAAADPGILTLSAGLTFPALGDSPAFVGSRKCKKCHLKQYKSWKKGKKFSALETLKPGQASEAKGKHNLDPAKDYSKDVKCLACHTTGFGKDGGYAIPDPTDKKAVKKASKLAGIGCESCHGPGGAYITLHTEIMKSKRTYTDAEMYGAGLHKIEAATCTACHNEKGPTYDAANPFDFAKKKQIGAHEHFPLKQRKE